MKYRKILMKYNAYLKVLFSLVKNIKSDISVVENINFWMTSAFFIIWFCFTSHYARRYMSNGMIHIQRPCREFARAFNKFSLVESWIWIDGPVAADTSYGERLLFVGLPLCDVSAATGPCIQKTTFNRSEFVYRTRKNAEWPLDIVSHCIMCTSELQRQVTSLFVNKNIKCGYSFS